MSEEQKAVNSQNAVGSQESAALPASKQVLSQDTDAADSPLPLANGTVVNVQEQSSSPHMEVHKHPHHVTHKKKWTEYFLEFFMLFLAVFLGFVAENVREHQVEKQRGREYIESFYEDLKIDTTRLSYLVDFETKKIATLSHLQECYDSLSKHLQPLSLINVIKNSNSNNPFLMDGRTIRQLTNAGGFRLLPKIDADSIIAYEKTGNNLVDYQSTLYQQAQDNLRNTFNDVISFAPYSRLFSDIANNPVQDGTGSDENLFFTTDKILLNRYFNQLFQYLRTITQHRNVLKRLNDRATRQIAYFRNKYHLG